MQLYQEKFIELCLKANVLRFGEFTLKSGRISPYFFNAGLFNSGEYLNQLGQFYAQAIIEAKVDFDMLFGPAYKGIPLACAVAIALADKHNKNYGYAFNRKEAKDHGEGGSIVGKALEGNVLIIDDVITAGTAIRQSIEIINAEKAKPCGIVVAMDRQEKGKGELSAIQEIEQTFDIPVVSLIKLETLMGFVKNHDEFKSYLPSLEKYQEEYGICRIDKV